MNGKITSSLFAKDRNSDQQGRLIVLRIDYVQTIDAQRRSIVDEVVESCLEYQPASMSWERHCGRRRRFPAFRTPDNAIISGNPEPDPLDEVPWLCLRPRSFHAIDLSLATPQIHVFQTDESCPLDDLVPQEQRGENGYVNIRRDKALRVEPAGKEAVEAVEDGYGNAEADCKVGQEWLQWRLVWQARPCYSIMFESIMKPKIGDADTGPNNQGADRGEIRNPEEDIGAPRADVEIDQQTKQRGCSHTSIGNPKAFEFQKCRCSMIQCCRV